MSDEWVDFKKVKEAVDMQRALDHYGIKGLTKNGDELRGPCPIHKGASRSKNFTVNVRKNAFKCFLESCEARGNVLDFVAAMENCSVRDAAFKLREWFKVGESAVEAESVSLLTPEHIKSLELLIAELDTHSAQIAFQASLAEAKIAAIKEIITAVHKGGS